MVPIRARQWLRRKWAIARSPRAWWERLYDPVWRWRHGQAHPWERKVAEFFKGMWDGTKTVFERGDPRKDSYWRDRYKHLRWWEKSLLAWVLGSWMVLAKPFRRAVVLRVPDEVTYPDPEVPGSDTSDGDGKENGMSFHEQEMLEKADALAEAIENFCQETPMMEVGRALESFAPAEERIATAFANLATRMREEMPLNEDFIEGVDLISEGHHDVASTCAELPNSWRASHQADIDRVENPRPNEEYWDASANRE